MPYPPSTTQSPVCSTVDFNEKPSRWYKPRNTTHHVLRAALIATVLVVVVLVIFQQQLHSAFEHMRDSISTCPARNNTPTIFREHEEFQTWNSSADQRWHDLITPNGGFIIDPTRTDSQVYGIAMFHQLHCVQMFRADFQELYARLDGRSDGKTNVLHHLNQRHTLHCLDYLRQVFLCYADGSIEPTIEQDDGSVPKTNGMVPHYCGNPAKWYDMSLTTNAKFGHKSSLSGHTGHVHSAQS